MLKKTISYTDFDNNRQTEDLYFNLTKAEMIKMELEENGEFSTRLKKIGESNDGKSIIVAFEDILRRSYGVRSDDGKRFIKSDQLFEEFQQTEAYSELFTQLATDATFAADFINGLSASLNLESNVETNPGQTASEVARLTSQATLQGHLPKKAEHEGYDIVDVPEPTTDEAPRKLTVEEINNLDVSEVIKAQLRASL